MEEFRERLKKLGVDYLAKDGDKVKRTFWTGKYGVKYEYVELEGNMSLRISQWYGNGVTPEQVIDITI